MMNQEKYKDDHRRKIMEYTTKKTELVVYPFIF